MLEIEYSQELRRKRTNPTYDNYNDDDEILFVDFERFARLKRTSICPTKRIDAQTYELDATRQPVRRFPHGRLLNKRQQQVHRHDHVNKKRYSRIEISFIRPTK